ncbi:hypothetical protein TUMEXPCC7403_24070 [Tumidithrix helvetica PCC 7403]|uniref:hypothetical protein n=1 Tax=Tumidithrix helvetica TaxID=3457545 RepID=UPI003CB2258E
MHIQSIQIEVDLEDRYTVSTLHRAIQDELQKYGKPLNWVALDSDKVRQKVNVKAMVLVRADSNL